MNHVPLFILLFTLMLPLHAFERKGAQVIVIKLQGVDIVDVKPSKDVARETFDRDWGQFEIRIPKDRFPIPAPNCRKNIILRMPGVGPDAPLRNAQLNDRWHQFQLLNSMAASASDSVDVRIAPGPYMKIDKQGEAVLEHCNAYFAG